jgi:hypothetical protein
VVEGEAANRVLTLAGLTGTPVCIAHLTCRETLAAVEGARARGQTVSLFSNFSNPHIKARDTRNADARTSEEKSKMKAYEIPIKVTKEGKIELLDALLELLPREQVVRVIILVPEPTDAEGQAAWSRLTTEQFFAGYSEADSIYDRI